MLDRWWTAVIAAAIMAALAPACGGAEGRGGSAGVRGAGVAAGCSRAVLEGEVKAGQGFERTFTNGLKVGLEPTASGWVLRVLPTSRDHPREDYAAIATPPYRSVSPLLVSTDFSFRAQDAVGWNPRRFRYAGDARAFAAIEAVYREVTETTRPAAAVESKLAELVARQPEGVLEILDASLAPGTADQTRAAGVVSSHFGAAAHRIEQPEGGRATALGRIGWMRFRLKLDLGRGVSTAGGTRAESFPCGAR